MTNYSASYLPWNQSSNFRPQQDFLHSLSLVIHKMLVQSQGMVFLIPIRYLMLPSKDRNSEWYKSRYKCKKIQAYLKFLYTPPLYGKSSLMLQFFRKQDLQLCFCTPREGDGAQCSKMPLHYQGAVWHPEETWCHIEHSLNMVLNNNLLHKQKKLIVNWLNPMRWELNRVYYSSNQDVRSFSAMCCSYLTLLWILIL